MKNESIIVEYVSKRVYADTSKKEIKYFVQFAGFSDNPSKLMRLQVWEMPFKTMKEAEATLKTYLEKIAKGSFMIFFIKN